LAAPGRSLLKLFVSIAAAAGLCVTRGGRASAGEPPGDLRGALRRLAPGSLSRALRKQQRLLLLCF
jgi:hypothetical protein